jgi:hypothetical protein
VPQFSWTDDTHAAGGIAVAGVVWTNNVPEPTKVDATFDKVGINVLDPPVLPAEFTDSDFANWGVSPLGLPGNLNWSVLDASILDGNLVPRETPEPWGPAIIDTSNGSLHLQSTNPVPLADPAVYPAGDKGVFPVENFGFINALWNPSLSIPVADATVTTKVRVDSDSQQAVILRLDGLSGYTFTASGSTDEFILARFVDGDMNRVEIADGMEFQNGEEWWMEASANGDQLSMYAWPEGGERPNEPLIQWTDDTHLGGSISLTGNIWTNNVDEPTKVNVTFDDVSITGATPFLFCAPLNELAGDLDGSGTVGFSDFLLLADNFGEQVATYSQGDIDCNGSVEFADFLKLSENFGKSLGSPSAAAVPEPTGFGLISIAMVIGLCSRRRNLDCKRQRTALEVTTVSAN